MKKILISFLACASLVSAAEPLYKGKAYLPSKDGVALSMDELNLMKAKIEEGEKQSRMNKEYAALLEEYRSLKNIQEQQVEQYVLLDKMKQDSVNIYKEAVSSYKALLEEMRENNSRLGKQLSQKTRTSRWQRNLNFLLGFAAPILGARAFRDVR